MSSGITAEAFLKRTAVARADSRALERMAPSILALADHEGFPAHGNAIRERLGYAPVRVDFRHQQALAVAGPASIIAPPPPPDSKGKKKR